MLESLKTLRIHVHIPWANQFWSLVLLMITSWKTWLQGDPRMKFSIFWTRPIYSGTPNHILALKLTPMVVNTPPLAFVQAILLTFVITYNILVSISRWSIGQILHSCLVITSWFSIRLLCLSVNSKPVLTFLTTIALGNPRWGALSNLCTWMVMQNIADIVNNSRTSNNWSPLMKTIIFWREMVFLKEQVVGEGSEIRLSTPPSPNLTELHRSTSRLILGIF